MLCLLGALTWRQTARWRDAETLWRHARAIDPRSFIATTNLAEAHQAAGRLDLALLEMDRAVALQPDSAKAWIYRGQLLAGQGRLPAALADFQQAVRVAPRDPRAHHFLGLALERLRRPDEALRHYDRALELAPRQAETYLQRAGLHWARRDSARALADWEAALPLLRDPRLQQQTQRGIRLARERLR